MRLSASFVFGLALFLSSSVCAQQNQPSTPPTPPAQDPQAVSVVNQALAAAGGITAINAINDYTAMGDITYHLAQDLQGSVTIRGSSLDQLRFDATLVNGVRSEATAQGVVTLKGEDGTVSEIDSRAPFAASRFVLPYLLLASILKSSSYSIFYKGVVQVDGHPALDIRIQYVSSGLTDSNGLIPDFLTIDYLIDASTFQVVMVQDVAPKHRIRKIRYSDYRVVKGALVPFSIDQTGGQQPCSIQLSQITFNSGLQDSDFQL